ncbi:hypothetical protein DLD77_07390 [Chitinophaga alhagiae]|uniref:Uncharacterized protein n=2 Tax=Chitinophaga alhagiae TaxID=2203219 RepID=A0ABM6WC83_9BACT|nr:hypothetical protein DLD77_07390 [Chitinophaga alhagiae]
MDIVDRMKKLLSIFLMSLMCIQVLPIKEVGKLLFNNQIVEEHVDGSSSSSKGAKLSNGDINCHRYSDYETEMNPDLFLTNFSYGYREDIPASPIQEIQTPPPNNHLG